MLGSNLYTNPGADLAVEQRPQPLEQSWKKVTGTLCLNSCASPPACWTKPPGNKRLPEIPARLVQQPRNMSLLSVLQCCESYSGMDFLKVLSFQERGKKNTRGSKHPNSLRTTLKRVLSSAPFTCFCMCQVPGCTPSRHQTLSQQSRAPPAPLGWLVSLRRARMPPSILHSCSLALGELTSLAT